MAKIIKSNRILINDWHRAVAKHAVGNNNFTEARRIYRALKKNNVRLNVAKMSDVSLNLYTAVSGTVQIDARVIKVHKQAKNQYKYDVAYALDSNKSRSEDNSAVLGTTKPTCVQTDVGKTISLRCGAIQVEWKDDFWRVVGTPVVEKRSNRKYPDTTKEILHKALVAHVLDCDDATLIKLRDNKILPAVVETVPKKSVAKTYTAKILKSSDELRKKQLVYGVVYAPDVVDAHGDWADGEAIEEMAHNYLEQFGLVSYEHKELVGDAVRVCESYIAPIDMNILGEEITKGSWVMCAHIIHPELWEMVESGELDAFSIEGFGVEV